MHTLAIAQRTLVIIPVYNESRTITDVIKGAKEHTSDIFVIDDCSTDSSSEICRRLEVEVIRHRTNQGKAQSLKDGFRHAIQEGYDSVIMIDGDMEHDPSAIPLFLDKLKACDMVVGQRKDYRSGVRKILNKWSKLWFRLLLPDIEDVQCGYRAVKVDLLKRMNLVSTGFEIEMEMLLEAVRSNARIETIPIKTVPRKGSNVKTIDYVKMNNFFDRWVIKNYNELRVNSRIKRYFLLSGAYTGLCAGGVCERVLRWTNSS